MTSPSCADKTILLTFDVEDWFQVENFKEYIPYCTWPEREIRVERNTLRLLDLLDNAQVPIQSTFFVLGWIAQRYPDLVREIHNRGHEVASHGFDHHLCYKQTPDELQRDLLKSKELLEEIIQEEVIGYRAPSFSITDETISIVREAGYLYDSSYNSFEGHGRYGSLTLPKSEKQNSPFFTMAPSFFEIPVSNLRLGNKVIPWGGGGYFRLLPAFLHRAGIKKILNQTGCYTFYLHPWEIDPKQPQVTEAKFFFRFRHYLQLNKTKKKLNELIAGNSAYSFLTCRDFLEKV